MLDNALEFSHIRMTGVRRSEVCSPSQCTEGTGGSLYLMSSALVIGRLWYLCVGGIGIVYKHISNHTANTAMMEILYLNLTVE